MMTRGGPPAFMWCAHPNIRRERECVGHPASKKLSSQNCCRIIINWQVGDMSLERHFRSGSQLRIWIRAVLASVVLIATLAARNVATHFPQAQGLHFTISADTHDDQRPRFDSSGSEWSAPGNDSL